MHFAFGVKTNDVEEAALWVAQTTGLIGVARESSDKGGNYYSFDSPDHEELWVVSNRDVYDGEPVIDGADDWKIAIMIWNASERSPVVRGLLNDPDHFVLTMKK